MRCADVNVIVTPSTHLCPERDSLARKSAKSGQKSDAVDDFRGVLFDDWLRLFMQVSRDIHRMLYASLTGNAVLFHPDEARPI